MDSFIGEKSDNQVTFSNKTNKFWFYQKKKKTINSGDNLSNYQTIFLCPKARFKSALKKSEGQYKTTAWGAKMVDLGASPHFHGVVQTKNESSVDYYKRLDIYNHHVLPLLCSNNKDGFVKESCGACRNYYEKFGKDDYICRKCCRRFHKECVESPLEITHPYHPEHSLKLVVSDCNFLDCVHCGKYATKLVYTCELCNLYMHPVCAMEPLSFVLDKPKRHDHPLTFFTRLAYLDCNVCGLTTSKVYPTYICIKCNFVAHRDCAYSPGVISISRHNHRISFVLSFPPKKWSCGICGKNVDSKYGGYTCNKCDNYAVHSRCALRKKDVWDEKDLEGVPEEDDIEENVETSFEIISQGIILHFSHAHPLRVETSKVYDERKICQACISPIYEGDFYSCMECDFILHDTCTNAPRQKHHALHSHPLTLKVSQQYIYNESMCNACWLYCYGFIYQCDKRVCFFQIDIKCASISEPFHYQGHEHPLFLALTPGEVELCHSCKLYKDFKEAINCIECDFIICFGCVTLPYMTRYKHDEHFLTLGFRDDETTKPYWCEICEEESPSRREERFYICNQCCTTLHVDCLLGKQRHRYMKPSVAMKLKNNFKVQILPNYNFSRPMCDYCQRRCRDKIFFRINEKIYCSSKEIYRIYLQDTKDVRPSILA